MTPMQRVLANVALENENRARRANTLLLALCFVAMGCGIRRMCGLPDTAVENVALLRELRRWQEDLSW